MQLRLLAAHLLTISSVHIDHGSGRPLLDLPQKGIEQANETSNPCGIGWGGSVLIELLPDLTQEVDTE